jgi:biotin transport system substrate-specific component
MLLSHSSNLGATSALGASRSRTADLALRGAIAIAASLFVAACAHIAVPLPFTPIPFTLQPFAVILVGMLLGPTMGFAALAAYLAEGAAGLPVFTPGALQGVARLIGPSAGYLFAYPIAAAIAGALPRIFARRNWIAFATAGTAAMLLIYTCGAMWFSHALHLSFGAALAGTVAPFAPSDAVKIAAAAGIASAIANRARRA